jgi:hypothetical protein
MFLTGAILLQNAHLLSAARRQPAEKESDRPVEVLLGHR